jgi:group I intron endonuclease
MSSLIPVYGLVYLLTCSVNGKKYVGQTVQTERARFKGHLSGANTNHKTRRAMPLAAAIRKYGEQNFTVSTLCVCLNQDELDLMEDMYIVLFDTMNRNVGYNLKRGGAKGKLSERTKQIFKEQRVGSGNSRYLHDLENEEIARLYAEGNGTTTVAELLGISAKTVANRLATLGVPLRRTGHPGLTDEEKLVVGARMKIRHKGENNPAYRKDISTDEIVRLRREGKNHSEIGRILSVGPSTIGKRLRRTGIKFDPLPVKVSKTKDKSARIPWGRSSKANPNWNSGVPVDEVARLYLEEGYSTSELCKLYSVHSKTIKSRLTQAGIVLKRGPRAKPKNVQPATAKGSTII